MKHFYYWAGCFALCAVVWMLAHSCADEETEQDVPDEKHSPEIAEAMAFLTGKYLNEIDMALSIGLRPKSVFIDRTRGADAFTPDWSTLQTFKDGEDNVYMFLLEEEEPTAAYVQTRIDGNVNEQFSKTTRKLWLCKTKGNMIGRIFTFIPDPNFLKQGHSVEELGYQLKGTAYSGVCLVSDFDGRHLYGDKYKEGKRVLHFMPNLDPNTGRKLKKPDEISSTDDHIFFRILKKSQVAARQETTYTTEEIEGMFCPLCNRPAGTCDCEVVIKPDEGGIIRFYCIKCGGILPNCFCCPVCNNYPCTCRQQPDLDRGDEKDKGGSDGGGGQQGGGSGGTVVIKPESKAKDIFRNSQLSEDDWKIIDRMLDKIMAECMGEGMYNALKNSLDGKRLTIQFGKGVNGGFNITNGSITIGQQLESNQLFHEMFHALQAYRSTLPIYNQRSLNFEIETHYAQYLYLKKLPEFKNSKWEERYETGRHLAIAQLRNYINDKGELIKQKNMSNLNEQIRKVVVAFQEVNEYLDFPYLKYSSGTDNFNVLREVTKNCE